MSRGFVKEGDQEEMPIIPPRAILPVGMTNYVTPNGYDELIAERSAIVEEKKQLQTSEEDNRVPIRVLDIKLSAITERVDTAEVIDPVVNTPEEVRFGVKVSYRVSDNDKTHTFRIVGVDEADVGKGSIAFTAPIAQALVGKQMGEEVEFHLGGEVRIVVVTDIKK